MASKRNGKRKTASSDQLSIQTTMRINPEILERADALVEYFTERRGRIATRADVIRESLVAGLTKFEAERRKA